MFFFFSRKVIVIYCIYVLNAPLKEYADYAALEEYYKKKQSMHIIRRVGRR